MIVQKTRVILGSVSSPAERLMNDLSWNKLSFVAAVG